MSGDQQTFIHSYAVSHETIHKLSTYEKLLIEWNQKFNLVSASTLPHIWTRHFSDSAQLARYIPVRAKTLADMGSGAGFPGLVLAIMRDDVEVTLIEATGKKAEFLQTVATELGLKVIVRRERIEAIKDLRVDVVTARALKALPELLKYASQLTHKDTLCLFPKGRNAADELTEAAKYWTFNLETHPSLSDDSGTILLITRLVYKSWLKK